MLGSIARLGRAALIVALAASCDASEPTTDELAQALEEPDADLTPDAAPDAAPCECVNPHGTTSCAPGGGCLPVCSAGAANCDGDDYNGCELLRDNNPLCSGASNLGSVSGDTGAGQIVLSGATEAWATVTVTENSSSTRYLSARVDLISPPDVDFDLCVYCASCGGSLIGCSTAPANTIDYVYYRHNDSWWANDTRTLVIKVYYDSGTACGNWTLRVFGNVVTSAPSSCP